MQEHRAMLASWAPIINSVQQQDFPGMQAIFIHFQAVLRHLLVLITIKIGSFLREQKFFTFSQWTTTLVFFNRFVFKFYKLSIFTCLMLFIFKMAEIFKMAFFRFFMLFFKPWRVLNCDPLNLLFQNVIY
jgi:hypothetical protein